MKKINILVITETQHIKNVDSSLESIGKVNFQPKITIKDLKKIINKYEVIFTNPNKSKIYIGEEVLKYAKNLKVICTASTGTIHIDQKYTNKKNIAVISLKKQIKILKKISSTAELAFLMTLSQIRNLIPAYKSVLNYEWDYTNFIGDQINSLTIGVIGFGRLGKIYCDYCLAFKAKVLVYDPFKKIRNLKIKQEDNLTNLLTKSDVISIHVHATDKNKKIFGQKFFNNLKKNVIIINTSRGELIDEDMLLKFLKNNPSSKYATDVLSNETESKKNNKLIKASKNNDRILITPHIGGMTKIGQEISYNHAVKMLNVFLKSKKNEEN